MKNKKELEKRAYNFEVRAEEREDGTGIITGRPIVYEAETIIGDYFKEIISRGALDGTDLTDVRFLVNHNTEMIPLARSRRNNGNSTMQLSVDYEGLTIETLLDIENNNDARALFSAVKRGDITGMSFMFSVTDEEWEDLDSELPTRRIKSIGSVIEVSAVTWPAYEQTDINARNKEALESARSAVETARNQRGKSLESDVEIEKARILAKLKF